MMARLINAEFIKLRTTQVWFWLLLTAAALALLFVIGPIASGDVHSGQDVANIFASSGASYIVVFVLGVLGVTTEFRYQTITPTVLGTPSRWTLVTAKMIAYAVLGAIYAAICLGLQLAVAVPWLSAKDVQYSLGSDHIPRAILSVFTVVALFGIIGLGVGALLKNQIVAVTVGVIFLLVLENLLLAIPGVRNAYPFMPGGGVGAVLTLPGDDRAANGVQLLSPAGGVAVLLAWAFIPAILGAAITLNRDIT